MIGYLMIWVILAMFLVIFLILFTITLIRVGIGRLREKFAGRDGVASSAEDHPGQAG